MLGGGGGPVQRAQNRQTTKKNNMAAYPVGDPAIDSEGRVVFSLPIAMSSSPRGCDESVCSYQLELETLAGQQGGFEDMLTGGVRLG